MASPIINKKVYESCNYTCQLCGEGRYKEEDEYAPGHGVWSVSLNKLEVDHIVPRSKGGKDSIENLQILCKRCNVFKKDKTWEQAKALYEEKVRNEEIRAKRDKSTKAARELLEIINPKMLPCYCEKCGKGIGEFTHGTKGRLTCFHCRHKQLISVSEY